MATAKEAITAYIAEQTAVNDQADVQIDGIAADIKFQADLIKQLQNSPDGWTAQDQAALDALGARNKAALDKLTALNALTDPNPPQV